MSGAAIAATSSVVNRLSQADPLKIVAGEEGSMPKPCDRWCSVIVMSPRPMSLTKPPVRMTA